MGVRGSTEANEAQGTHLHSIVGKRILTEPDKLIRGRIPTPSMDSPQVLQGIVGSTQLQHCHSPVVYVLERVKRSYCSFGRIFELNFLVEA